LREEGRGKREEGRGKREAGSGKREAGSGITEITADGFGAIRFSGFSAAQEAPFTYAA
jgi:hypothetical protein